MPAPELYPDYRSTRDYTEEPGTERQQGELRKNSPTTCHSEASFIGEKSVLLRGSEKADSWRDNAALRNDNPFKLRH